MLPALLCSETDEIQLKICGGTDVKWSPPFDYFDSVFLNHLKRLGVHAEVILNARGYYPEGGGEVILKVKPTQDLERLKDKEIVEDIHCVTSWSKFDTRWGGISFKTIFKIVKPKNSAHFVEFYCADKGFTTTVPIENFKADNVILALTYQGLPINDKHGGPVRAIIPDLYFFKSAKWIIRIEFLQKDRLGYWERQGYSNKANPWKEQRYSYDD